MLPGLSLILALPAVKSYAMLGWSLNLTSSHLLPHL